MRVSIYALTLALFILASFSVPIEVLGAPAPTYTPGVKPGDSWSYGDFGCAGAQCTTGGFTSIAAVAVMVQSVVGPTVTSTETVTYTDGRALTDHFVINVQTGVGNGSIIIIAGGLGAGTPIFNSPAPFTPTINATISKVYAGRQRSVNILEFSTSSATGFPGLTSLLYDQQSGILLEIFVAAPSFAGPSGFAEHAVLQSTNVWSSENEPHFSLGVKSFFINAPQGSSVTMAVTATSVDFSKTIGLTASVFPTGHGPTPTIGPTITATKDGSAVATLSISTANAFIRYYIVSVTGVSGTRSDTTFLLVNATTT